MTLDEVEVGANFIGPKDEVYQKVAFPGKSLVVLAIKNEITENLKEISDHYLICINSRGTICAFKKNMIVQELQRHNEVKT